jgi:P4 family phage/plasmid primase-like protien
LPRARRHVPSIIRKGCASVETLPGGVTEGSDPYDAPYASSALIYLAAGWSAPLPVGLNRRDHPPAGFTGEQGRDPTREQVEAWRRDRGAESIAVRMPQNVLGIDVDAHDGKQGLATLAKQVELHGDLPATWSSTSREDGSRIMFFRAPAMIVYGMHDLGPGVETIRHVHRYAAVWPTVSEKTNKKYRWYRPDGTQAPEGQVPRVEQLAELPREWFEARALGADGRERPGRSAAGGGSGGRQSGYTDPDIDALLRDGIPAGMIQDEVLRDLVWHLVCLGESDVQIGVQWQAVVDKSPTLTEGFPWSMIDFQRHLSGARRKIEDPPTAAERLFVGELMARGQQEGAGAQEGGSPGAGGGEPEPPAPPPARAVDAGTGWDRGYPLILDHLKAYTCDQGGMAELAVELFGASLRWERSAARFMLYDPHAGRWATDGRAHESTRARLRELAVEVERIVAAANAALLARMGPDEAKAQLAANRAYAVVLRNAGVGATAHYLQAAAGQVAAGDFDAHPALMSFPNGTYDVDAGTLREHRREDHLSTGATVALDPALGGRPLAEVAPHFHGLLWRMCGAPGELPEPAHRERYEAVARWLGYQLHGSNPEKTMAVLEGATNIGKNQLMEVVGEVLGRDAAWLSARPVLIVRSARERPDTEESRLAGKRMVVVNELTESQVLDEGQVLRLVNPQGTLIDVRRLYQDPVAVPVTWKLTTTTNELPRARMTEAVLGRLLMFRLSAVPVAASERYDVKREILARELPAVAAHLVRWWRQWWVDWDGGRGAGLLRPAETAARAADYARENVHPAAQFLDECCQFGHAFEVPSRDLWEACERYYRSQHSDLDRRYTGGRRKLFSLVEQYPGVARIERGHGDRPAYLTAYQGLRLLDEMERFLDAAQDPDGSR